VELGGHLRHVGLNGAQNVADRLQERRKQCDPDEPIEQVSDRQPITRGVLAVAHHRIDCAATVEEARKESKTKNVRVELVPKVRVELVPYVCCGSKCEELALSISCPLYPRLRPKGAHSESAALCREET
jgi:hypothetical protein